MRKHLGGELPAFSDKLGSSNVLPKDCLAFSHGRAALTWFIREYGIQSVAVCAYTCPKLIACLESLKLHIVKYDIADTVDTVNQLTSNLPAALTLIPALFGGETLIDPDKCLLSIVDAAQTAFGYKNYPYTVLSCPRKATSLPDGAILRIKGRSWCETNRLPIASRSIALKTAARVIWTEGASDLAVHYNKLAEDSWPPDPCRMSPDSLWTFERMDSQWHEQRRIVNYRSLELLLDGIPYHEVFGVPFCYPLLVKNRDEVLDVLHYERIFANKLWYNAEIDRERHPVAARYVDELICLPVDQRHTEADMERIASVVRVVAEY